jgi:glycosyltransferase involved in cell wall biosynthesis
VKICFYNVTATYIHGGLETYCWEAGRALARRGHQVTIVAGNDGDARHDEVRLVQFPFVHEKSWPDFGTRFRRLMERLSFARHSMQHLVSEGYDAVIVNKPFDFPILWRAKQRGLKAQTVFRSGGKDFYAGDRYFTGAINHWLSTSLYNARQVEKRYARPVGVIHNGVDIDEFHPLPRSMEFRSRLGIAPDAFTLVSIGRLVGLKGLRVAIEALKNVPGAHFIIAGDGPEHARLVQQAQELGVADRIHFAGRVAHDVLPVLLADADAFVQPSIGEESFGISLVEAMACGLPVLASKLGGMLEIVDDQPGDHQTGELLPPGDVPAWTAAIQRLATDDAHRKRLGDAGRLRADQHFTWAANALKLEQMLTGQWSPLADDAHTAAPAPVRRGAE